MRIRELTVCELIISIHEGNQPLKVIYDDNIYKLIKDREDYIYEHRYLFASVPNRDNWLDIKVEGIFDE